MSAEIKGVRLLRNDSTCPEDAPTSAINNSRPGTVDTNAFLVTWDSIARTLADVQPIPAAGALLLLVIIVLSLFGRLGSLIVGILAGLLLHASLDKPPEVRLREQLNDQLKNFLCR